MPAPIEDDPHQDRLQAVGKALDALLLTLYRLTNRHNDLKHHTEHVFKQVIYPLSLPLFISYRLSSHPSTSYDERI